MSGFRWLLAVGGVLVLLLVFWLSRRESAGRPTVIATDLLRRRIPGLTAGEKPGEATDQGAQKKSPEPGQPLAQEFKAPDMIVTVRLTGRGSATFGGESLLLALQAEGLRHGQFGIFHRHDSADEAQVLFSVASLAEPGSFDLSSMSAMRFPGVSIFLTIPGPRDALTAFDAMLSTAHALATSLDGELLDEHGSRLSIQRERFLREEVIQLRHRRPAS
ncbi:MAG: hypothetical protein AMXMBFR45_16110 [Gammaproteobacteria bacterium]|nr:cell division protein ZipA [Gammaproteobacteria bacterium PRO8]MDL1880203.1 cell division protein ZipA [Gammaproteobacteria bacterium PRO2]GIK34127.1 MAG: hypothetical protein BroJett010_06860 [Gammaproteobacteria bacterium]